MICEKEEEEAGKVNRTKGGLGGEKNTLEPQQLDGQRYGEEEEEGEGKQVRKLRETGH